MLKENKEIIKIFNSLIKRNKETENEKIEDLQELPTKQIYLNNFLQNINKLNFYNGGNYATAEAQSEILIINFNYKIIKLIIK